MADTDDLADPPEGGERTGPGQPRFVPTRRQRDDVALMAACGYPHRLMLERIINPATGSPISEPTLRVAFEAELADGLAQINARVTKTIISKALSDKIDPKTALNAAIYWDRTRTNRGMGDRGDDSAPNPLQEILETLRERQ